MGWFRNETQGFWARVARVFDAFGLFYDPPVLRRLRARQREAQGNPAREDALALKEDGKALARDWGAVLGRLEGAPTSSWRRP